MQTNRRRSANGSYGGIGYMPICRESVTDTWHETLDEAKEQAEYEYEGIRNTWIYVDQIVPSAN
jgi:hypothetical protein